MHFSACVMELWIMVDISFSHLPLWLINYFLMAIWYFYYMFLYDCHLYVFEPRNPIFRIQPSIILIWVPIYPTEKGKREGVI